MVGSMILESLSRRKTRTLLTVAGVASGVAAIVALGAVGGVYPAGGRLRCGPWRRCDMNDK